ncbi:hypothetical protein FBQ96_12315 [Nitrospirales bacterium NOB]|nr:hypothetical protein [Nitrospirota bacterium]MDL1890340.1 hypothetical protein [Nitrospirales bacterium NOB]MEB2338616.1 hypothetical protein [Nitrospirales bacterium]QOJ33638.1 MAG: hypothetical protein HRU82_01145 [Nitrospira sp.]
MPADNLSDLPTQTNPISLERLTQDAVEAARAGTWDRVEACYAKRGILLADFRVDPELARRLCEMDQQVRAALLVAQAGILSLLEDSVQLRRQLRKFTQIDMPSQSLDGRLHVEG